MSDGNTSTKTTIPWRWRIPGVFGIGFFVLFAVGAIGLQGTPPSYTEPIERVRDFFADSGGRYIVGDFIAELAFVLFLLPFVAGLRGVLGRAEGEPHTGSRAVFAGGLATVAVGAAATSFLDAVALERGGSQIPDSVIRTLLLADTMGIAGLTIPMALLTFASAAVIWKTSALWRWLAFIGAGAGLFLTVGSAFPLEGPGGVLFGLRFVGLILFLAFVILSSINMLAPNTSETQRPAPDRATMPDDQRLGRIVREVAQQELRHGE